MCVCVCFLTSLAELVKEMLDKELRKARDRPPWSTSRETETDRVEELSAADMGDGG